MVRRLQAQLRAHVLPFEARCARALSICYAVNRAVARSIGTHLYRGVDSRGQTIDFLLSAKPDAEAAKRFFRRALAQPHTVNPHTRLRLIQKRLRR